MGMCTRHAEVINPDLLAFHQELNLDSLTPRFP